jgi:hypothetical protein
MLTTLFLRLLPMQSFPLSLGVMWIRNYGMYLDAMGPPLIQLTHNADKNHVHHALFSVGGIHFTVLSGMILIASMTPRGALRLNPQLISDEIGKDFEEVHPPEQLRLGKTHPISEKDGSIVDCRH